MPHLNPKPEQFYEGTQQVSARAINKMIQAAIRQVRGGNNASVDYYGDRIAISANFITPQLPDFGLQEAQFTILDIKDDVLICTPFIQPNDGDGRWTSQGYNPLLGLSSSVRLAIAKPYVLQKTPWDGRSVNIRGTSVFYIYDPLNTGSRTANGGTEYITPPYFRGEVIRAARMVTGYLDPNLGIPIGWADTNTAGRTWAPPTSVKRVAVFTKTTLMYGTPPVLGLWAPIKWDTVELLNQIPITYDAATGQITLTGDGIYHFCCRTTFGGPASMAGPVDTTIPCSTKIERVGYDAQYWFKEQTFPYGASGVDPSAFLTELSHDLSGIFPFVTSTVFSSPPGPIWVEVGIPGGWNSPSRFDCPNFLIIHYMEANT